MKPVLIVHPDFYYSVTLNIISELQLLRVDQLPVLKNHPSYIIVDDHLEKHQLILKPLDESNNKINNKKNIEDTSWYYNEELVMYRITDNRARYVIWNKDDAIPICSTVTERIEFHQLGRALVNAKKWAKDMKMEILKSIIVFDLDDTLINENLELLQNVDEAMQWARKNFDLMVLWTHGNSKHLQHQWNAWNLEKYKFDKILARGDDDTISCKNLLFLYNYFPKYKFTHSVLIDDTPSNITPEYTNFIIPLRGNMSIRPIITYPLVSSTCL